MKSSPFQVLDLSRLAANSSNILNFLMKVVKTTQSHVHAKSCSLFIITSEKIDADADAVTPKNAQKIRPHELVKKASIGEIDIVEEQFAYTVAEKSLKKQYEKAIDKNKLFLAVPIVHYDTPLGSLVVTKNYKKKFSEKEIIALRQISSQLSSEIGNISLLFKLHEAPNQIQEKLPSPATLRLEKINTIRCFKSKPVSPGIALGAPLLLDKSLPFLNYLEKQWNFSHQYTIANFENAVKQTRKQITALQKALSENLDAWAKNIFVGHLLILQDIEYIGKMRTHIQNGENPPDAILALTKKFMKIFFDSQSLSIREKAKDIEDLGLRLLKNLLAETTPVVNYRKKIVFLKEILPSEILQLKQQGVKGVILTAQLSSLTSHSVLIARSLALPVVVIEAKHVAILVKKESLLINGASGDIFCNPSRKEIKTVLQQAKEETRYKKEKFTNPFTIDKVPISILANINVESQMRLAAQFQADGVGLYRTEFPFMIKGGFLSEEEQFFLYKRIVEKAKNKEVTIRSLDIGGDKILPYYSNTHSEPNPSLGLRSIRFSLKYKENFIPQIKAILRCSADNNIKLLLPMISSLEEILQTKKIIEVCKNQLRQEKVPFNETLPVGVMIEVPSLVWILKDVAKEVDFFSIGTNDLVQYLLAADRNNFLVSDYLQETHPAVLKVLHHIITTCKQIKKEVTLCGIMAENLAVVKFLLGAGLRRFSLSPEKIPKIKKFVSATSIKKAEKMVKKILACKTIQEVRIVMGEDIKI